MSFCLLASIKVILCKEYMIAVADRERQAEDVPGKPQVLQRLDKYVASLGCSKEAQVALRMSHSHFQNSLCPREARLAFWDCLSVAFIIVCKELKGTFNTIVNLLRRIDF